MYSSNRDGDFIIEKYHSVHKIDIKFINTGTVSTVAGSSIRRGECRDKMAPTISGVGFVGVGSFIACNPDGSFTTAYSLFKDMMWRCYNPSAWKKNPGYADCSVCDEWHNFQVFAKWVYDNLPTDHDDVKYHLDKDVKHYKNKVYCPDYCSFIPADVNLKTKHYQQDVAYLVESPDGDEYALSAQVRLCKVDPTISPAVAHRLCLGQNTKTGWRLIKKITREEYEQHIKKV